MSATRRNAVIIALLFGALCAVAFALIGSLDEQSAIQVACVCLTCFAVLAPAVWYLCRRRLFEPFPLFLLSAFAFNAGQAPLNVMGLLPNGMMGGRFSYHVLSTTTLLVYGFLSAMVFGGLLGVRCANGHGDSGGARSEDEATALRYVGYVGLAVSVGPALYQLAWGAYLTWTHGYFALYQQPVNRGPLVFVRVLAALAVPSCIFVVAGSKERSAARVLPTLMMIVYCLGGLLLGTRGVAIMAFVSYAYIWHRCINPFKSSWLLVMGILFILVIPLVKEMRGASGTDKLRRVGQHNASFSAGLEEMGGSMLTVAHTVASISEGKGYEYGEGYGWALTTLLPNFHATAHPAVTHSYARLLVKDVAPAFYYAGGGLGFSFVAEAYLNFGFAGALVFAFLIGFILSRVSTSADADGALPRLALVASILFFILIWPRSEASSIARGIVWYSWLPYLSVIFLARRLRGGRGDC